MSFLITNCPAESEGVPDDTIPITGAQFRAIEQRLDLSECRLERSESRLVRSERRLRATWAVALVGMVSTFALGMSPTAQAQYGVTLASLNARLTTVETSLSGLVNKTQFMSVSGNVTRFTGTNVQVVSGSGATNGTVNGLGNLIIGYNALRGSGNVRTGSHNLVVGDGQNYSSYGGMVAGFSNSITGIYASVSGGGNNTASGPSASVSGGNLNTASGGVSSVSGGQSVLMSSNYGWAAGGNYFPGTGPGVFHSP